MGLGAIQEGSEGKELHKDAPDSPHVNCFPVITVQVKHELRRQVGLSSAIEMGFNIVGEPCMTKVSKLYFMILLVDAAWPDVSVDNVS